MAEKFYCMKCRKKVQVDKFEKKTLKTKTGERHNLWEPAQHMVAMYSNL